MSDRLAQRSEYLCYENLHEMPVQEDQPGVESGVTQRDLRREVQLRDR